MEITFELIQQWAWVAVSLVGAVGLVPMVNWLKDKLGIQGGKAQLLAGAVATIVAILTLIVNGQLTPDNVSPEQFTAALILVWTASQEIYKRLTANEPDTVLVVDGVGE
jgi:hypothetical protein